MKFVTIVMLAICLGLPMQASADGQYMDLSHDGNYWVELFQFDDDVRVNDIYPMILVFHGNDLYALVIDKYGEYMEFLYVGPPNHGEWESVWIRDDIPEVPTEKGLPVSAFYDQV